MQMITCLEVKKEGVCEANVTRKIFDDQDRLLPSGRRSFLIRSDRSITTLLLQYCVKIGSRDQCDQIG